MKAKSIQRILCVLLAVAMVFAVVGCSGSGDTESFVESEVITGDYFEDEVGIEGTDSSTESKTSADTVSGDGEKTGNGNKTSSVNKADDSEGEKAQPIKDPYANIPANLKGTTVKFATWIDHKSNESASVLKNFTAKTGIKVELVSVPQSGYMTKLVSMIASDNAPDVFVDNGEFPVSLKVAQPLNSYINLKDTVWDSNIKKFGTIDGKTFIINGANVHWNFVTGVFFHKAIAEENGIKTPYDYRDEGNWTWETMRQFMIDYDNIPGSYYGGYVAPEDFYTTCGTALVKYNNGKWSSGIGDTNLTKAYQFYLDIKKNGYMMDSTKQEYMCNGTQALWFGSSWMMTKSAIAWETLDLSAIGFIEAPSYEGCKNPTYEASTRAYGICQGAKNPKGAGYFLRYFLDGENYKDEEIWKNVSLATEMVERVRKANSKKTASYDFSAKCMSLVSSNLAGTTSSELNGTDPTQIATVLKSKEKVMKNAAAKATSLFKSVE